MRLRELFTSGVRCDTGVHLLSWQLRSLSVDPMAYFETRLGLFSNVATHGALAVAISSREALQLRQKSSSVESDLHTAR